MKWLRRQAIKKSGKKILLIVVIVITVVLMLTGMFKFQHHKEPLTYGASFSIGQAKSLGLDWQAAYTALFKDLRLKHVRLMSYWEDYEKHPGNYSFTDLDKEFAIAKNYGAKVSLAIGLRQPRWPECHEPAWAKQLDNQPWQAALEKYIAKVVQHYKGSATLESWQLENEYFNRDFGKGCRNFSHKRIKDEYTLVKQLDSSHPVIMNQSNQGGLPLLAPHPDAYGFSVYRRLYEARLLKTYITHPVPAWFHSLRAMLVEMIWRKPVIIHELQAEPWTKGPLTSTSGEEQDETMSPLQLKRNLDFARHTGIKMQYLWGAEWWYWKKIHGNPIYWQIIQQAVKSTG